MKPLDATSIYSSDVKMAFHKTGCALVCDVFSRPKMIAACGLAEHHLYGLPSAERARLNTRGEMNAEERIRKVRFPTGIDELDHLVDTDRFLDLVDCCLDENSSRLANAHLFIRNSQDEEGLKHVAASDWHFDHDTESFLPPHTKWDAFNYLNTHIFLSDVLVESAPMTVALGSHIWTATSLTRLFDQKMIKGKADLINCEIELERFPSRAVIAPAGSVLFYSSLLLHKASLFSNQKSQRVFFGASFFKSECVAWHRHAWPYSMSNRRELDIFCANTSTRGRSLIGWPPPGHPYYCKESLARIQRWYPGIDLRDYFGAIGQAAI